MPLRPQEIVIGSWGDDRKPVFLTLVATPQGPGLCHSDAPGAAELLLQMIAPLVEVLRLKAAKDALTPEEDRPHILSPQLQLELNEEMLRKRK